MTHFRENIYPLACISGNCLEGNRKKEDSRTDNWISIHSFLCEVTEGCDNTSRKIASRDYGHFKLCMNVGDSIAGRRGIVEPADGYKSSGYITKKKPKKVTRHNPPFTVKGCPAVCYYDNLQTRGAIKLREIKLHKIRKE